MTGERRAAPGARQRLQHVHPPALAGLPGVVDLLLGLGVPVRGDRAAHPQPDPEGRRAPALLVVAADDLGRAHQRRRALELLGGEQAQRVAHEDGDAVAPVTGVHSLPDHAVAPADREGVGGEPEVGLGLTATGREEQQVDGRGRRRGALGMPDVGQRGQVEQHEGELERAPARVLRGLHLRERLGVRQSLLLAQPGDGGVPALQGHHPVGEPERGERVRMAGDLRVGQQRDARADAGRGLPGGLDGAFTGKAQRRGQRRNVGGPLVEPAHVAVGERRETAPQRGRVGLRQLVHRQLRGAHRTGGDGGGHVVVRQPGRLQLPRGPGPGLGLVRVDGDVVADGEPELVAVEQPQVQLLGVVRAGPAVGGVVDRGEHRRGAVERGDRDPGLVEPRLVGPAVGFLLRVDQGQPDDPLPVAGAHLDGEVHLRGAVVADERDRVAALAVEAHLPLVAHRHAMPDRAHPPVGRRGLLGVVAPPLDDGVQHVDVGGHGERQPHRRGPHPPQVLRGDDLGQVGLTVAGDPGLGVGYAVGRVARGLERGLGAEHPDEVAIARPARARREPLLRAVPRSEQVTLDQALQLAADLVRRGGSELLRHIE